MPICRWRWRPSAGGTARPAAPGGGHRPGCAVREGRSGQSGPVVAGRPGDAAAASAGAPASTFACCGQVAGSAPRGGRRPEWCPAGRPPAPQPLPVGANPGVLRAVAIFVRCPEYAGSRRRRSPRSPTLRQPGRYPFRRQPRRYPTRRQTLGTRPGGNRVGGRACPRPEGNRTRGPASRQLRRRPFSSRFGGGLASRPGARWGVDGGVTGAASKAD